MDDDRVPNAGLHAYDLEPPARNPWAAVGFTPLRNPQRGAPAPSFVPPPVPDGHVRVQLDDDYEIGATWSHWTAADSGVPHRIHDIPLDQFNRWAAAQDAYVAMQAEIEALMGQRRTEELPHLDGVRVPPGWQRKGSPYQPQP